MLQTSDNLKQYSGMFNHSVDILANIENMNPTWNRSIDNVYTSKLMDLDAHDNSNPGWNMDENYFYSKYFWWYGI